MLIPYLESRLMAAEDEETIVSPPSSSLIPARPEHFLSSRRRAEFNSMRVNRALTGQNVDSQIRCTDISTNLLMQTGLSHDFGSGGFGNCPALMWMQKAGAGASGIKA